MIRESRPPSSPHPGWRSRLVAGLAVACLVVPAVAAPAAASPDTMRRSFSNMFGGPCDMLLSPFSGAMTLARNLQDVDDSTGVRVVYSVPGWVWLTGLNLGSGAIRAVTGALELVPGILLFPFETDLDPLFDPVEDAGALIDLENPIVWIENPWVYKNPLVVPFAIRAKWGISYTRAEF